MEFKFVGAEFYHDATNSYEDNVYVLPAEASDLEVDRHIYPDFDVFVENVKKEYPDVCLEDCHWDWYEIDVEELRAWCYATAADNSEACKLYHEYCATAGISPIKKQYHVHVVYDIVVEANDEEDAQKEALDLLACDMIDASDCCVEEI